MARSKIMEDKTCPFCNNWVSYWPNCSASTCADYNNVAWVQTKRGLKQYFHKSCFYEEIEKQKKERSNNEEIN